MKKYPSWWDQKKKVFQLIIRSDPPREEKERINFVVNCRHFRLHSCYKYGSKPEKKLKWKERKRIWMTIERENKNIITNQLIVCLSCLELWKYCGAKNKWEIKFNLTLNFLTHSPSCLSTISRWFHIKLWHETFKKIYFKELRSKLSFEIINRERGVSVSISKL